MCFSDSPGFNQKTLYKFDIPWSIDIELTESISSYREIDF